MSSRQPGRFHAVASSVAEGWRRIPHVVQAIAAGLAAVAMSIALIVSLSLATWAAMGSDVTETGIVTAALDWWMTGFGAPLAYAGAEVTVVPLGLSLVTAALVSAATRRVDEVDALTALIAGATSAVVIVLLALVPAIGVSAGDVAAGAAAVGLTGAAHALWVHRRLDGSRASAIPSVPLWARLAGTRAGAVAAVAVASGSAVTAASAYVQRHAIAASVESVGADGVPGLLLAIGELAYVPNLAVWSAAWLAGADVSVGTAVFSTTAPVEGELPLLPILGAFPAWAPPSAALGPLLIVAAGAAIRYVSRAASPRIGWIADGLAVAGVALGTAGAVAISTGAAGPGSLAEIGPLPWETAWRMAMWSAIGIAAVAVPEQALRWWRAREGAGATEGSAAPQAGPAAPAGWPRGRDRTAASPDA